MMIKAPIVKINSEHDMELALKRLLKGETFISVHPTHNTHSAFMNMIVEHLHEQEKIKKLAATQSSSLKSNEDSSTSS